MQYHLIHELSEVAVGTSQTIKANVINEVALAVGKKSVPV